jgi:tubulin polyglutamylase TTLL5
MDLLWARIYDVILKSIISGEHYVVAAIKKNQLHRNNCFEVFGYDILLDSELKPWLLEVNLSPSLACESPLDTTIKANLISDTFTLIGVQKFDRKKENLIKLKNRAKITNGKANNFVAGGNSN